MATSNRSASYWTYQGNASPQLQDSVLYDKVRNMTLDEFEKFCANLTANVTLLLQKDYNLFCPEERFLEYEVIKALYLFVPLILISVGTFGNIFTFIVLRSRSMKNQSTYIYLSALAIADTTLLYFGLLPKWLTVTLEIYDILGSHKWVCKTVSVVFYTCENYSAWLIVAVTVDRYVAVCKPLKAPDICNQKKARIAILTLFMGFLFFNCHLFWTVDRMETVDADGSPIYYCNYAMEHHKFITSVWPWIETSIYPFLPFVIIMILNSMIVHQLVRAQRNREHLSASVSSSYNSDSRSFPRGTSSRRKLTIMLLTVSFTFLLTTLPMNIVLICTPQWNVKDDLAQKIEYFLGRAICDLIMYLNHSMNFFLYCAPGQKFRSQMVRLLKSFCCKTSHPPNFRRSFPDQSSTRSTRYRVHMDYAMEPISNYHRKNCNQLYQDINEEMTQMTIKGFF